MRAATTFSGTWWCVQFVSLASPQGSKLRESIRFVSAPRAKKPAHTSVILVEDLASPTGIEVARTALRYQATLSAAHSRLAIVDSSASPAGLLLTSFWSRAIEVAAAGGDVSAACPHLEAALDAALAVANSKMNPEEAASALAMYLPWAESGAGGDGDRHTEHVAFSASVVAASALVEMTTRFADVFDSTVTSNGFVAALIVNGRVVGTRGNTALFAADVGLLVDLDMRRVRCCARSEAHFRR